MRLAKQQPSSLESAPDGPPLIASHGLTVEAGGNTVLNGVDMEVRAGEIVTMVGPNGAGKTTLVRALLGLQSASAGSVTRRPGLRVGYLPQRFQVDIALPITAGRLLSLASKASVAHREEILDEVGAAHLIGRMLANLSGGELQRVLLARALLKRPELLILDEPDQGVDVTGRLDLFETIAGIRVRRGCGILLISHDLHLVMSSTDRVICLNGHVCCSGHPSSVMRHPAYIELFGTRAASGLAVYTHEHDHTHPETPPPERAS
ncbi:MAG: metal ABC transporter ATP-binding protein [bacterium]